MIFDARKIVENKLKELIDRVQKLKKQPELTIIRIGEDLASAKYVNNKVRRCEQVGIKSNVIHLDKKISNEEVERIIEALNESDDTTGVLLQLPIPSHLDEKKLTEKIISEKDVDGFTIENMCKLILGEEGNVACTPKGIIDLLEAYDVTIEGKDVLIINRSNIVGKPLAHLFLKKNATVTIAHSKTLNLKKKIKEADIVVLGVGQADFVGAEDFKDGAIIVDVSINFKDGKMCGDVKKEDYDTLVAKSCCLTPVPFGVGQMTVLSLIEQTISIAEKKENQNG